VGPVMDLLPGGIVSAAAPGVTPPGYPRISGDHIACIVRPLSSRSSNLHFQWKTISLLANNALRIGLGARARARLRVCVRT